MGCNISCKRLSFSSTRQANFKNIRIVHMDGFVEEIESSVVPVRVAQVTTLSQKHFLFTQAQVQLLQVVGSVPPLKPDHLLEPGRAYFLLPYSLFEAHVSPLDLAPIARKLVFMSRKKNKNVCQSPGSSSSPNGRFSGRESVMRDEGRVVCGKHKVCKSWKPILTTIQEMSLSRRIGSDLVENVKVDENAEQVG